MNTPESHERIAALILKMEKNIRSRKEIDCSYTDRAERVCVRDEGIFLQHLLTILNCLQIQVIKRGAVASIYQRQKEKNALKYTLQ